jgi:hypothetical protein
MCAQMHLKKWVRKLEGIFYGTSIAYDKVGLTQLHLIACALHHCHGLLENVTPHMMQL